MSNYTMFKKNEAYMKLHIRHSHWIQPISILEDGLLKGGGRGPFSLRGFAQNSQLGQRAVGLSAFVGDF